jgi:malonyl-CoA O-methyltransferase
MLDPPESPFVLDQRALRRSFDRAAKAYDGAAFLQRRVADSIFERLALFRIKPIRILDLGVGTGYGVRHLARRYRGCHCVSLDLSEAMVREARRQAPWFSRRHSYVAGDAVALPIATASIDLIYSNLTLQWVEGLDAVFAECRRTLRPGGLLLFTTLGPDTLRELRASWAKVDGRPHVHGFMDLHDVGDALLRAGLVAPVLDVDWHTVSYGSAMALMRDLKSLGAHNSLAGRARGMTGKGRLRAMIAAYENYRDPAGRLPATYEVIHAHAFAGSLAVVAPGPLDAGVWRGEATVPVATIRRRGAADGVEPPTPFVLSLSKDGVEPPTPFVLSLSKDGVEPPTPFVLSLSKDAAVARP